MAEQVQASCSEASATTHDQASLLEKNAARHEQCFECMIEKLKSELPWQNRTTSFSRRRFHDQVAARRCVREDTKIDIDVQAIDKKHMFVSRVADEDVDEGSGSGDVYVMSGSGSICVRSDESHIEGSENKGQYVGCFEHDVEICVDPERAKSNVVVSDPSSSSTLRRQQQRQHKRQPKHK